MKILYVITRSDHGGAQVAVLDIVRHLPSGYEPVIAAGEHGFLEDECRKAGIAFRFISSLVQPMHPLRDVRALWQLSSLIKQERPSLIHSHTSKAGLIGRTAAWLTGTPSVFTAHTWSFDEGVPTIQRMLSIPMEKFAAALGGKIITVSDANTAKALAHSIAPASEIVRVWNGIPDCETRAFPGRSRPATIISVARMVPQKDFATLLRGAVGLKGDWRIQLVGDGPERPGLEALSRQLKLQDRVEFLGRRLDVGHLLAQADIFVLASHWEGLPISILEAMRAGLPVIASDVGGVKESVIDGITGFVAPPRDPGRLRSHLQMLIDSPGLLKAMGQAGREAFEAHFHIDASVRMTLGVYAQVLGNPAVMPVYVPGEETECAPQGSLQ
jgi:glycosyltransferase involved in cell wall biosynthesis